MSEESQNIEPKGHEVGYGKPSKQHQFKPGQSGNLKGRPKGTRNLKTDLAEELGQMVKITENGEKRSLSKQRVMIKTLVAKAAKGDPRATKQVFDLMAQRLGDETETEDSDALSPGDQAIVSAFLARQAQKG